MKLMYLNGALTGQTVELQPAGTTIGRESDNAIQLPMGGVSRYHAKIECDASGNWQIRDLGSTNGTLVDDVPVKGAATLSEGSVITIGDQHLRCISSSVQTAPPSPPPAPSPQTVAAPSAKPSEPTFFFRPLGVNSPAPQQTAAAPSPKPPEQKTAAKDEAPAASVTHGLFSKNKEKKQQTDRTKKILGNIIFALIVLLAACIGLWLFLKLNETTEEPVIQQPVKKKVENPFVLYFEKESVEGVSVFRFTLLVENGRMEVTLDEPKNNRRYYELSKESLPDSVIEKLKQQILDSGFMDLQQEKIAGTSQDNRQHRRIMVGFGSKFCDVKVTNDMSDTFNRVESIINETLLDEYDLGVISQDVDRILADAHQDLFIAEEAFRSIDTTPSNLPVAIARYRRALRRYQLFDDPRPVEVELRRAREGLAEAEEKLEEIHQEGLRNVRLFNELREYEKAIAECNRLLAVYPPDSKIYQDVRETKIKLEKKLSLRSN